MTPASSVLTRKLTEAGIPIDRVYGPPATVVYGASATAPQIAAGDAIAAAFVWADHIPRTYGELLTDLQVLSNGDKTTLANTCLTYVNTSDNDLFRWVAYLLQNGAFSAAITATSRLYLAAAILRESPNLAVNAGVNVPGDKAVS